MSVLQLHECLGHGGYGEVYRATWAQNGTPSREVAVKLLNPSLSRSAGAKSRLRDEARVLARIRHPHILRVHTLCELDERLAMVAEFVPGNDLDRCILGGLPERALVEVIGHVASALHAAWNSVDAMGRPLRLVHRDIKPENIRVTPSGVTKLLDFGVALAASLERESHTATNTVMGSYRYMAPERFDAAHVASPSVDVFALGCILYEGAAFRRLFEQLSMREMMMLSLPGSDRYMNFVAERLEELPEDTDARLVALIHRLVDREPEQRPTPEECDELCRTLAAALPGDDLLTWARQHGAGASVTGNGEWSGRALRVPDDAEHFTSLTGDLPARPTAAPARPIDDDPSGNARDVTIRAEGSHLATLKKAVQQEMLQRPTTEPPTVPLPPLVARELPLDDRTADDVPLPPPDIPTEPTITATASPLAPPQAPPADPSTVELDDLRRAIGLNPDRAPRPSAPVAGSRSSTQALTANLAILGAMAVIGAILLAAWLIVALF